MNLRTNKSRHLAIGATILTIALRIWGAGSPVGAQAGTISDDEVNRVAAGLYCPVCENTPLDVCPTQACADWREVIRTQLAEGRSQEEIYAYFAERYGHRVLAEPPRAGFGLLIWSLPVILILVGGLLFTGILHHLQQPRAGGSAAAAGDVGADPEPQVGAYELLREIEREVEVQV